MKLLIATISPALSVITNTEEAKSIEYFAGESQIVISDLGLIRGGTASTGLAISNRSRIVGLANNGDWRACIAPVQEVTTV
jgi:hypothetical protein